MDFPVDPITLAFIKDAVNPDPELASQTSLRDTVELLAPTTDGVGWHDAEIIYALVCEIERLRQPADLS